MTQAATLTGLIRALPSLPSANYLLGAHAEGASLGAERAEEAIALLDIPAEEWPSPQQEAT